LKQLINILAAGVLGEDGDPVAAGFAYIYSEGTGNLRTVYENFTLTDPLPNPVPLDAYGSVIAYTDERLRIVVVDSDRELVRTYRNVGVSSSDISTGQFSIVENGGLRTTSQNTVFLAADGVSVEINSDNSLRVKDSGVRQGQLAARTNADADAIDRSPMLVLTSSASVSNPKPVITSVSRGIEVSTQYDKDNYTNVSPIGSYYGDIECGKQAAQSAHRTRLTLSKNSATIATYALGYEETGALFTAMYFPPAVCFYLDAAPASGSSEYDLTFTLITPVGPNLSFQRGEIYVVEL
jgi:hypothetical protein